MIIDRKPACDIAADMIRSGLITMKPPTGPLPGRPTKYNVKPAGPETKAAIQGILERVAKHFGISEDELTGQCRTAYIVEARHIAMHLIRKQTGVSSVVIADIFLRDHGSVLYAWRRVKESLETSASYRRMVEKIE